MRKLLLALLILISITPGLEAKKKKKKFYPRAFLDFEGRRTTRLNQVFAAPLDRPDFDFLVSRNSKKGRTAAKIFFEREADISVGNSFELVGNFGLNGAAKGVNALATVSFEFGKGRKKKVFSATASTGTVTFQVDEKTGITYMLVRATTTNGEIRKPDVNGDLGALIKEVNLSWEMDIPFVHGYITQYQDRCFQPRDPDGIQQECVTTVDENNSFK